MNQTILTGGDESSQLLKNETDDPAFIDENVFDRLEVRITFIVLYVTVFCFCVFGNLLVILVVMLSRRLRSTELFLGNLAIADFCVGIFCILQTISSYITSTIAKIIFPTLLRYIMQNVNASIIMGTQFLAVVTYRDESVYNTMNRKPEAVAYNNRWIFGNFVCKMHYFIHSLSCTASIIILVVISIERYLAIIHPIRSRQIMTPKRLKLVIVMIWLISSAYSSPRFFFAKTISHTIQDEVEVLCIISRVVYNSELFDIINFILLYLIPLATMSILYTRIAITLWKSAQSNPSFEKCGRRCSGFKKSCKNSGGSVNKVKYDKKTSSSHVSIGSPMVSCSCSNRKGWSVSSHISCKNVLRARRGVIKMLILVVVTFAVCNASFHARKMWQYWSHSYDASSNFSSLFTPVTFFLVYCNSAINPLLYAFLSRNFRKSMMELSLCKFKCFKRKKSDVVEST